MKVVTRSGVAEDVAFDKIASRLKRLCGIKLPAVDVGRLVSLTAGSMFDGISTVQLDELTAEISVSLASEHPDYGSLAARILVSNWHKQTNESVIETYRAMSSALSTTFMDIAEEHAEELQTFVEYKRDFHFDFFGIRTFQKIYCTKIGGKNIERPQHVYLRVALAIGGNDMKRVRECYALMSKKKYTHASPTLFNAGMKTQQLASCFTENTMVCTVNKGPIPIRDVCIGDLVVTHKGRAKPVTQLHINPLGNRVVYNVKAYKTMDLEVTGNHRMWSLLKGEVQPGWHDIESLNLGDYVAVPKRTDGAARDTWDITEVVTTAVDDTCSVIVDGDFISTKRSTLVENHHNGFPVRISKTTNPVRRCWIVDEDFAWFMGVWYGDGSILHPKAKKGRPSAINIVGATTKAALLEKVIDIGRRTFGTKPTVYAHKGQDLTSIVWNSATIAVAFEAMFGHGHLGKRLCASMFSWNKSLVTAFLGGFVSSDGCVSKTGGCTVFSTSFDMLQQIYHLCRQVGIVLSLVPLKKTKVKESHHDCWVCAVPWTVNLRQWVYKTYTDGRLDKTAKKSMEAINYSGRQVNIDGTTFVQIVEKSPLETRPVHVYTLGVKDDHSYNVQGLVCENCFLHGMEDSLDGIFKSLHDIAQISKLGGGIGMHVGDVRSKGSLIHSTNGTSDGIIPMLKVGNEVIRYVNQSGRRKGSMAIFIGPDHPDILEFLDLRRPGGDETARCRDLFLAMWIPDIFMRRVESNQEWSFFDPSACPGLNDVWGSTYDDLYATYEKEGKATRTMPARDLWTAIIRSQVESGNPYLLYKDAANRCSNQQNLGTIKCSNLCSEIIEFTSPTEVAVCTLASISLPAFIKGGVFDFKDLHAVTKVAARNLDTVIDINHYPIPEAKNSNEKHRPIGIGIQGLADCFMMLGYAFESDEAALLNTQIAATMYHAAIEQSAELARDHGPYASYVGSPASLGKLQYDLWGVEPDTSTGLDWIALKRLVKKHGLRNSLSIALMPTASTSQLFGNNESFEPVTSLIYTRRTLAGEFTVVNKHLVSDLIERGLWSVDMKDLIVANGGSVQTIAEIDDTLKSIYKTSWEISQRSLIDQSAARGPYVCQSQSLNLFVAEASLPRLSTMHFYAWRQGLKTGCYYLRTRAASQAKQITVSESQSCIACSS